MRDPFREGLAAGWKHIDASPCCRQTTRGRRRHHRQRRRRRRHGRTADRRRAQGRHRRGRPAHDDQRLQHARVRSLPELYQESAARKTADKAINILQGRCVGGSTTVNWTSSFRTPPATLRLVADAHGLKNLVGRGDGALVRGDGTAPRMSARGPCRPTRTTPSCARGAEKLGIPVAVIPRNVKVCWNLGYCGMGCPTNAKQSMLVTTIPAALSPRRDADLAAARRKTANFPAATRHRRSTRWRWSRTACTRAASGSRCAPAISSLPAAPSTRRRCCCAARPPTRTACSASAPSCTRPWFRPALFDEPVDAPMPARRSRSIPTTS